MRFPLLLGVLAACRLVAGPVDEMAGAARNFLAALTDEQRAVTTFEFKADERENWHFIPKERKGITVGSLKPAQQNLAFALLSTGLSPRGFNKATTIMSLEQILQEIEGPNRRFPRDPQLYHISIFGTPDTKGTWGWRYEGHHMSFNFTIVDGQFAAGTPTFLGTNPAEVRTGPRKGLRVLSAEEDLARDLLDSLSPDQRKKAVILEAAPDDILTVASRKAEIGEPKGLAASELTPAQRGVLDSLVAEYVGRLRGELASADLAKIDKAGRGTIRFAWAGSFKRGERHYYRVHGPTFLLEYDNTQNDANHVHAVWRDFANDFGRDLLGEHLKQDHTAK
jgi:hypothetical protein